MAKKPQLKFSPSEELEALLARRVREANITEQKWELVNGQNVCMQVPTNILGAISQVTGRIDHVQHYHYVGWDKTDENDIPRSLVDKCRKQYEDELEWLYVTLDKKFFYAFPGALEAVRSQLEQAWLEYDVERKLEPLFRAELKDKAHKFLAKRAIYSRRGGKYRARDDVRGFATGYIAAWERFDQGRTHPRPYVLAPSYGKGASAVAYLLSDPPEKILEDAENEFAVHIVMGS